MRPVIVGIAPSRPGAEGQPLTCLGGRSTGDTLRDLSGHADTLAGARAYLMRFDRVNLSPVPQPSTIEVKVGRPMAMMLAGSLLRGRRVVLLGSNVAECFCLDRDEWEPCSWHNWEDRGSAWTGHKPGFPLPFSWAVLPHPSGRNLWYNDPRNRGLAREFMTELAEGWEGAD